MAVGGFAVFFVPGARPSFDLRTLPTVCDRLGRIHWPFDPFIERSVLARSHSR
jgi:hypothetical protein